MNAERAKQLRDERRTAEQACIEHANSKIEKYATAGKSSCVLSFKTGWKANKCHEHLTEQGFECEWTRHTNSLRCKW